MTSTFTIGEREFDFDFRRDKPSAWWRILQSDSRSHSLDVVALCNAFINELMHAWAQMVSAGSSILFMAHTNRLSALIPKGFNQLSEEDIIAFRIKPMESIYVLHLKWQSA